MIEVGDKVISLYRMETATGVIEDGTPGVVSSFVKGANCSLDLYTIDFEIDIGIHRPTIPASMIKDFVTVINKPESS